MDSRPLGGTERLTFAAALGIPTPASPGERLDQPTHAGFSLIGLTILVAGVAGWLGVAVARGRPRARLFSWVLCGATACGAATVLVLQPWEVVPWLPVVLQIAAAVIGMQAVAIAVLLSQPLSGRFFGSSRDADRDDQGQPPTNLDPAPAVLAPTASALPDAPADYDPFS